MAIFENLGFCPGCNAFRDYEHPNPRAETIKGMLGGREQLMVYEHGDMAWRECPSIVDAMLGGDDGILGEQLAAMFHIATAAPTAGDVIRKIRIVDVNNIYQLGVDVYYDQYKVKVHPSGNWSFFQNGRVIVDNPVRKLGNRTIVFDERYVVLVKDDGEGDIIVKILEIPAFARPQ